MRSFYRDNRQPNTAMELTPLGPLARPGDGAAHRER